jgi:hypothetical protein
MVAPDLPDLVAALPKGDAIAIVHHSLWNTITAFTWGDRDDPDLESVQTLAEIYSWHGSSEEYGSKYPLHGSVANELPPSSMASVQDGLALGHRFGIVAGDDVHLAKPGAAAGYVDSPTTDTRYSQGGLTAILADQNTRADVWAALLARRTYATTGARILLDVTLAGAEMGSTIAYLGAPEVHLDAVGTAPIASITVFRDGTVPAFVRTPGTIQASLDWTDPVASLGETHSYYVRVEQTDGHYAWSSPIWHYFGNGVPPARGSIAAATSPDGKTDFE